MTGELTFAEFCEQPLQYRQGMNGDWGAQRLYRNDSLGIQVEIFTQRKRHADIYSGWREGKRHYFLDRNPREFSNLAELYVAWMARVCGVDEEKRDE